MNPRQLIVLILGVACLVFAGIQLHRMFGPTTAEKIAARNRVTWRCRADGYETNLTVAEIDRLFNDGKWRFDATNMAVKLVACPKCGQIELEQISIRVDPAARK